MRTGSELSILEEFSSARCYCTIPLLDILYDAELLLVTLRSYCLPCPIPGLPWLLAIDTGQKIVNTAAWILSPGRHHIAGPSRRPKMADTHGTTNNIAKGDNFYTPENKAFYEIAPYQPLNNEAREIRLLAMSMAQQRRGQLELRLEDKLPLAHFNDFCFALSYAAGVHTETEVIRISADDRTSDFNAFSKLAEAIRAARDHGHDATPAESMSNAQLTIWADQICINQSDPDERAYQVEHMREIYQAADRTIIYLGEDEHDGRGIKYLESIAHYCREGLSLPSDNGWNDVLNQAAEWIVDHVRTPDHAEDWRAVCAILKAPWWRRGWVCQEAIVSNNAVILHGSSSMMLPVFSIAVRAFIRAGRNLSCKVFEQARSDKATVNEYFIDLVGGLEMTHAEFILQGVQDWAERNGIPFDDIKPLLRYARKCKTGDPRDRVYAFIGLADPAYGIKPSYKLTTSETFANTAACIMIKEKSLEVVFDAMDNSGMPNLPSWAADWSSPQQGRFRYLFRGGYSASADYPGQAEIAFPGASSGFCGPVLRMQVLRLGRLSVPERFGRVEQGQEGDLTLHKSWARKAGFQGEEMHDDLYIGGGSLEDAFISTLWFGEKWDDEVGLDDLAGSQAHTTSSFKSIREELRHKEACNGEWSFFVTAGGYMGLAVSKARHDDYLCIALGASVPMVLRRQGDCYSFIGEAYVQGMMHGEAIELMESGDLQLREVDVI